MLDTGIQRLIIKKLEKKLIEEKGEEVFVLSANFDNNKRILFVQCYYANDDKGFTEQIPYEELSYEE